MSATVNVRYMLQNVSATVQNKFQVSCIPYHEMSATINECQASYLEMLGTYPVAGIHEIVRY